MEYKWKAFSVTSVGALMSALDGTIVMLALLPIAEDLHTDYVIMVWVIIAYLLINTALVLSLGRLADIYGRKRMYNIGFIVFTIGSALCGFAGTSLTLILYRVIQGIGAALLTANSFAILSEAFPDNERGKAFRNEFNRLGNWFGAWDNTGWSYCLIYELEINFSNQYPDRNLRNNLGVQDSARSGHGC